MSVTNPINQIRLVYIDADLIAPGPTEPPSPLSAEESDLDTSIIRISSEVIHHFRSLDYGNAPEQPSLLNLERERKITDLTERFGSQICEKILLSIDFMQVPNYTYNYLDVRFRYLLLINRVDLAWFYAYSLVPCLNSPYSDILRAHFITRTLPQLDHIEGKHIAPLEIDFSANKYPISDPENNSLINSLFKSLSECITFFQRNKSHKDLVDRLSAVEEQIANRGCSTSQKIYYQS